MALTTNYLYEFVLKLIRKSQSGSLSVPDFQYFWNAESNAYQSDLLGHFEKSNNGKAGINTGLIQNQTILTSLTPFTQHSTIAITSGNATKPGDFVYTLALIISGQEVIHINHNQKANVNNSVIDPPSIPNGKYYYTETLDYYSILPSAAVSVDLDYISNPVDIVWGYDYDVDGRQVYVATGGVNPLGATVDPLWGNIEALAITKRMLKEIGVSFADRDFENFGNSVINTGN